MDIEIYPDWTDLPTIPLECVFSFLSSQGLCRFGQTCKFFSQEVPSSQIWKQLCHRLQLQIDDNQLPQQRYQNWFLKFGQFETAYIKVKGLVDRITAWSVKERAPLTLLPPAEPETIATVEQLIYSTIGRPYQFPADIRTFYLLTKGQHFDGTSYGMFGGYQFYHDAVSLYAERVDSLVLSFGNKRFLSNIAKGLLPICYSPTQTEKTLYLVLFDQQVQAQAFKRGQIVECSNGIAQWAIANSFSALLEHRVRCYEAGIFRVHPYHRFISLFPTNTEPIVTEGVSIKAAPLFICEKSTRVGAARFLWAYSITMSMSPEESASKECQLTMRHWDIRDAHNDPPQTVDGEGVIGAFPKMYPGAFFQYESCCPLSSPTGSMGGWFQMVRPNRTSFNAIVPTWEFSIPEMIEDYDDE